MSAQKSGKAYSLSRSCKLFYQTFGYRFHILNDVNEDSRRRPTSLSDVLFIVALT